MMHLNAGVPAGRVGDHAHLSFRQTDPRLKDGPVFTTDLLISAVVVLAVGIVSLAIIL